MTHWLYIMNTHVEAVADYIVNKVYPVPSSSARRGMKLAVSSVINILRLNTGIVLSTYCMSTSLNILALLLTGASGFFIYKIIRKIYIDIRTARPETGVTTDIANDEFSKIIGIIYGSFRGYWNFVLAGLR
jgi:Ni,Fe-hydrogenase I cytochrome b subunit